MAILDDIVLLNNNLSFFNILYRPNSTYPIYLQPAKIISSSICFFVRDQPENPFVVLSVKVVIVVLIVDVVIVVIVAIDEL